jgi:hypothetical protein
MKKSRKLTLNRDTLRNLAAPSLMDPAGGAAGSFPRCSGACTPVSCGGTCNAICTLQTCLTPCSCAFSACLACPI